MKNLDHVKQYKFPGYANAYNIIFTNSELKIVELHVISTTNSRWDHVSVTAYGRCPIWEEMCYVKELFFEDTETVMQLHVPKDDYVNYHPYCLHLWRPQWKKIPRPPNSLVGGLQ
jgi:hypothetical protein